MMYTLAFMSLLFFAQEEPVPVEVAKTTHEQRLAQDAAELEAALRTQGRELHELMMATAKKALAKQGAGAFAPSTVGGVRYRELNYCRAWNSPNENREGAVPADDFERPNKLPAVLVSRARELKKLGIDLLVVPVPLRTQVYPEHLVGVQVPEDFHGYGMGMLPTYQYLTEQGVEVLNLLPVFAAHRASKTEKDDALLYLQYDTHWTPRGCRLAADQVADRIQSCDWFRPGSDTEGQEFFVKRQRGVWSVPKNRNSPLLEARSPEPVWYEKVLNEAGLPAHRKDKQSSILLIGDSFSDLFDAHASDLASQLYARLGQRLDLIRIKGGGQALWRSMARRGKRGLEGKRLVIWLCSTFDFARPFTPLELFPEPKMPAKNG